MDLRGKIIDIYILLIFVNYIELEYWTPWFWPPYCPPTGQTPPIVGQTVQSCKNESKKEGVAVMME